MGSGAAGQPMNSDNTSWPFTSPAGKDATKPPKPHEIDLYIEPSPRDSPTALPKLFTTLEPTALPANAHVEEDLSSTPPSRDSPTTLPTPVPTAPPTKTGSVPPTFAPTAAPSLLPTISPAPTISQYPTTVRSTPVINSTAMAPGSDQGRLRYTYLDSYFNFREHANAWRPLCPSVMIHDSSSTELSNPRPSLAR